MSDIAIKASEPLTLRAQLTEDWLAVVIGLLVFGAALVSVSGTDLLGWAVTTSVYTDVTQALSPFAKAYASLGGGGALIATYLSLLVVLSAAEQQKFGISWSLKLTNEGGFIVALLSGIVIANFFPRFAEWLKEAIRPELYIKIAIVILGATVAITAAGKLNLASSLLLRGAAAIVEAYLIYWAVLFYVARKWFGVSRDWPAPLAAGI